MSLAALRSRNAAVFGGTALVVPPTSAIALSSGWSPLLTGTAIGAMTTATVIMAPVWGAIDDRRDARGLLGAAIGASIAALLLLGCALAGFAAHVVIPALCVFGATSGGLDPLVSARIQRSGWMHGLPRIRLFGVAGWTGGLVAASLLAAAGWAIGVYLLAAFAFAAIAVVEVVAPVAGSSAVRTGGGARGRIPASLVVFVLVGLPVPITAYSYLIYSTSALNAFEDLAVAVPFVTLIVLALLELPVFVAIGARLEGRNLAAVYLVCLVLLSLSWVPAVLGLGGTARAVGLLPYTAAVALWTVAQISAVRIFTTDATAGLAHSVVSSATKIGSALFAGSGVGWLASHLGGDGAPLVLLASSLTGLVVLAVATIAFPSTRLARIPRSTDERKHHVNSDRRPPRHE